VTITADATTVPTYPKTGSTVVANTITVAEVILGSVKSLSSVTDEITVTLPTGYTFLTPGTTATTDDFTTTDPSGTNSNVAKYDVGGAATSAAGKKVTIDGPTIFILSNATDGNVDATVTVKLSDGTSTKTSTVTLFKVASAATSTLAYTTGTTTAPTTYSALYAGRSTQSTGLDVAVKEVVGATLLGGGTLSLTLPTGVAAGKNYTNTEVTTDGTGVPALAGATSVTAADGTADESTPASSVIMATLAADTNSTAGKVTFKLDDLDLADTAAVGDLSVTIGGSAQATAGTVKVATIIRASDASVSGAVPVLTAGSTLSLPDVVITESKYGALVGSGALMGVYIANANGANLTTTGATVTAKKADGTDVSTTIFGAASATLTATTAGVATFPVTTASSSSTGPVSITIKGLKATLLSSAVAGDVTAVVGGASATTDTTPTSDEGAKAYKQSVTVGKIVAATVPAIPAATATGTTTALTLSGSVVAAGNDQGKIGTLFVVASLPSGQVFSRDSSGGWTLWDGTTAFKAVATGVTLGTHSVDILSAVTDVSGLVGTQVYLGYGVGAFGTSAYNNLLNNATYALVYTVQ
jgi:hypothetical protein